jgi:hypothetical protein
MEPAALATFKERVPFHSVVTELLKTPRRRPYIREQKVALEIDKIQELISNMHIISKLIFNVEMENKCCQISLKEVTS